MNDENKLKTLTSNEIINFKNRMHTKKKSKSYVKGRYSSSIPKPDLLATTQIFSLQKLEVGVTF